MVRLASSAVFLPLALASPVGAEVVASSDNGFVSRNSSEIAASPRKVWLALIQPGKWWNDNHTWSGEAANMTLEPSGGGCFCEQIPGEGDIPLDGSAQHAVVVQAVPDKALRMRGALGPLQAVPAQGVLTISLEPVDGGTALVWNYDVGGVTGFEIEVIAKAVDGVMKEQLDRLTSHLGALEAPNEVEPG